MKVFLTGATGYIGSVVAETLHSTGHEIMALARSEEAYQNLQTKGYTPVMGDLARVEALREAVQGAEAVVHTAYSHTPQGTQQDRAFVEMVLLEQVGTGKVFLYTSGISVYGDTGTELMTEDTKPTPERTVEPTMASVLRERLGVEQLVLEAASRGIRSVVVRPALAYGRGGGIGLNLLRQAAKTYERGVYVDSGESAWSTVHIEDLADLYLLVLASPPAGMLLNLTTSSPVTIRQIATSIGKGLGLEKPATSLSLEEAAQHLGPMASFFTTNMRVAEGKAGQLLGWQPRQLPLLQELEHGSYKG